MKMGDWIAAVAMVLTMLGFCAGSVAYCFSIFETDKHAVETKDRFEKRLDSIDGKLDRILQK